MLLNSLPHKGFPQVSNQPFDLILDDWDVHRRRYATIPLPDGTMPLFIRPPQKDAKEFPVRREYDLHYFGQLRPDTFNFAWNDHAISFTEIFKRDGTYRCYVSRYPRPPYEIHNADFWGCTVDELRQFQTDLLLLGQQWLARERHRQTAGLEATWLYNNIRMLSPTGQNWELWKCPWHPRTNGTNIGAEYPPDWIGTEPVDKYNHYREFHRIGTHQWAGPGGAKVVRNYNWHIQTSAGRQTQEFALSTQAIDAYWQQYAPTA